MTERKTAEQLYTGTHSLADAKIGDPLGSMQFAISADQVERNAWANDDYHPWYMDDSPFGGRILSPVFVASFDARLFYGHYAYPPGGSLFAKEEFEYLVPLQIAATYTITGTMTDIYRRRGRTFYVAGMSVADVGGTEVMRVSKTIAAPVKPVAEAPASGGKDAP